MNRIWILLFASTLLFACGGDETAPVDKGAEDNPLTDGKSDSFFSPTEHGDANFNRANNAEVSEDQTFHAWTFELSAAARLELKTEISTRNLDTVMYLYQRENEDESWGRYIEKNDDHAGNLYSQIDGEFEAGLYRVIVKPFKSTMTGSIALRASCEGDGCPMAGAGECRADVYERLPQETGFGEGCTEQILEVVTSELEFQNQLDVPVEEKCDLNSLAAKAVDYYVSYWDDIYGSFEDLFGDYGDDSIRLNVEEYSHDRGTVIWIDAYADEDGMRFVFDFDGELLGMHQSNQSPDNRFYCADEVDYTAEFPRCWNNSIESLQWTIDNRTGESGTITIEEAGTNDELDGDLISAIYHFSEAHDLPNEEELSYELITWRGTYSFGAEITLGTGDLLATYWVADTELVAVTDDQGTRYLCEFIGL